jgi:hypothetical protein
MRFANDLSVPRLDGKRHNLQVAILAATFALVIVGSILMARR